MKAGVACRVGTPAHGARSPRQSAALAGARSSQGVLGGASASRAPWLQGKPVAQQLLARRVAAAAEEQGSAAISTASSIEAQGAFSNGSVANGSKPVEAPAAARVSPGGISIKPDQLELRYQQPSTGEQFWTKARLALALPWRRFPQDSVLTIKLEGELSDQAKGWLEPGLSVPQVCSALQRAALDPRIKGLAIEVGPLAVGYAKLQEVHRHLQYFRASGKFTVAVMKQGGEKEYYLASACAELYVPPSASISLRGFVVGGTFLRGVLDKIGVEPQVQRIGQYKSAGDQLLRRDMSSAQREQLQCILEDTEADWVRTVATARNKSEEQVRQLLDAGVYDTAELLSGGWVDGFKYEDEVLLDLKRRSGVPEDKIDKKPLRKVGVRKINSVLPGTYGPALAPGKKRIVVLRTSGAILGKSSGSGGTITPDALIPRLRALASDKSVAGVVLRVDSPGGDALASDLMWREVVQLGLKKPVVASMADVAASGGYYISMAARAIVAEPLTVTGSIGVVTGKFNLQELYNKIGYSKELISRGKYAELLADQRPFTEDENDLFSRSAAHAYEQFRNKAAESRKVAVEAMQQVAQGRVWTGKQALEQGLVDALGGVHAAVQLVRQAADIPPDERVTVTEIGTGRSSPLALLRGATTAALLGAAQGSSSAASSPVAMLGLLLAPLLVPGTAGSVLADAAGLSRTVGTSGAVAVAQAMQVAVNSPAGLSLCVQPDSLGVQAAGSAAVLASQAATSPGAEQWVHWPWSADDEVFLNE